MGIEDGIGGEGDVLGEVTGKGLEKRKGGNEVGKCF
jgi:hypothetical protein